MSLFMPKDVDLEKLDSLVNKNYSFSDNAFVFAAENQIYALADFESSPLPLANRDGTIWGLVEHEGTLYDSWIKDSISSVEETLRDRKIAGHRGWSKLYSYDDRLLQAGYEKKIFNCFTGDEIAYRQDYIAGLGEIGGVLYDITKDRMIHETFANDCFAPKSNLFVTGNCVHNDKFYYSVRMGNMDVHSEIWYFDCDRNFKNLGMELPFENIHLFTHDGMLYHTVESTVFDTLANVAVFDVGIGEITVMDSVSKDCFGGIL